MTQETISRREARRRHFKILYNSLINSSLREQMGPEEAEEEIGKLFFLSSATIHQILHDDKYGQRNQYKEKK